MWIYLFGVYRRGVDKNIETEKKFCEPKFEKWYNCELHIAVVKQMYAKL